MWAEMRLAIRLYESSQILSLYKRIRRIVQEWDKRHLQALKGKNMGAGVRGEVKINVR